VFDGVHLGHRAVIAEAASLAAAAGGEAVVVTFDIHPRVVVDGRGPPMLTSLPHRLRLLEAAGAAAAVVLRFDDALRERSAEWFLEEVLVARMGIAGLVLGPDSHFGRDRRGNPELAAAVLGARGIPVRAVPRVVGLRGPVSSTAVREAIVAGDLERAAALLGRPPSLFGTVVRGDGRGRALGFPTANVDAGHEARPPRGVYAGRARLADGRELPCLVNVGRRPTFAPEGSPDTVEAWIPGFDGDLYGQPLEVSFLHRLRDEMRFDGPEALRAQIGRDHAAMVEWIGRNAGGAEAPQ
jgi:riboflavin kinase/FMN adenylyltransferase